MVNIPWFIAGWWFQPLWKKIWLSVAVYVKAQRRRRFRPLHPIWKIWVRLWLCRWVQTQSAVQPGFPCASLGWVFRKKRMFQTTKQIGFQPSFRRWFRNHPPCEWDELTSGCWIWMGNHKLRWMNSCWRLKWQYRSLFEPYCGGTKYPCHD